MFLAGVLSGASVHQIDPDEERDPPPEATPLEFPSVEPPECRTWDNETPPPNFQSLFTRILKPSDISQAHLEALNVDIRPQCSVGELLPQAPDGSSYVPSLTPDQPPGGTPSYADATKVDKEAARKRKDLDYRLAELRIDNATAYRAITRNFKQGVKPPRLAYMRVFWQGLESMSQFWDCTMDQYYEVEETEDSGEKSPKRQKLDTESDEPAEAKAASKGSDTLPVRSVDSSSVPETGASVKPDHPPSALETSKANTASSSTSTISESATQTGLRYKGLRTSSGRYMPDQFRIETLRGFIEGAVWPFKCNVHPPRMPPTLHIHNLKLPVRQSVAVYRLPADRARAKAGGIVGPVMGVQVRSDVEFGTDEGKARLDLMREVGGMLLLAQERAREGRTEVRPGEGKWWTTVPRWGGGPGGEVGELDGNSDANVAAVAEGGSEGTNGAAKPPGPKEAGKKSRPKKTPAQLWKELKPGSGTWDPRTDYTAVGKDPNSDVDEIFLLTSLNHHVALLRLSVHRAYTDFLRSGTLPNPLPADPSWCRPVLRRTRWFDLFVEGERVQAFGAVWGVMAYLTREVGGDGDDA